MGIFFFLWGDKLVFGINFGCFIWGILFIFDVFVNVKDFGCEVN